MADGQRLETGLQQLAAEDPTLTVETDRPTGTVASGTIGELHYREPDDDGLEV